MNSTSLCKIWLCWFKFTWFVMIWRAYWALMEARSSDHLCKVAHMLNVTLLMIWFWIEQSLILCLNVLFYITNCLFKINLTTYFQVQTPDFQCNFWSSNKFLIKINSYSLRLRFQNNIIKHGSIFQRWRETYIQALTEIKDIVFILWHS